MRTKHIDACYFVLPTLFISFVYLGFLSNCKRRNQGSLPPRQPESSLPAPLVDYTVSFDPKYRSFFLSFLREKLGREIELLDKKTESKVNVHLVRSRAGGLHLSTSEHDSDMDTAVTAMTAISASMLTVVGLRTMTGFFSARDFRSRDVPARRLTEMNPSKSIPSSMESSGRSVSSVSNPSIPTEQSKSMPTHSRLKAAESVVTPLNRKLTERDDRVRLPLKEIKALIKFKESLHAEVRAHKRSEGGFVEPTKSRGLPKELSTRFDRLFGDGEFGTWGSTNLGYESIKSHLDHWQFSDDPTFNSKFHESLAEVKSNQELQDFAKEMESKLSRDDSDKLNELARHPVVGRRLDRIEYHNDTFKKNALIVFPESDHNGSFELDIWGKNFKKIIATLSLDHNIRFVRAGDVGSLDAAFRGYDKNLDVMILGGHGSEQYLRLGDGSGGIVGKTDGGELVLPSAMSADFGKYFREEGAYVHLDGCNNGFLDIEENLTDLVAKNMPGVSVTASTRSFYDHEEQLESSRDFTVSLVGDNGENIRYLAGPPRNSFIRRILNPKGEDFIGDLVKKRVSSGKSKVSDGKLGDEAKVPKDTEGFVDKNYIFDFERGGWTSEFTYDEWRGFFRDHSFVYSPSVSGKLKKYLDLDLYTEGKSDNGVRAILPKFKDLP